MRSDFYLKTLLSTNGKNLVDLLKVQPDSPNQDETRQVPTNSIQVELVEIWKKLLHRKEIGIEDNFFKVGGNSLQVIQMISMIASRWHIELIFSDIMANATISKLSDIILFRINDLTRNVSALWNKFLSGSDCKPNSSFFTGKANRHQTKEFINILNQEFDIDLQLADVQTCFSLPDLIEKIRQMKLMIHKPILAISEKSNWERFDPFPLTLIQEAYWAGRFDSFELGIRTTIHIEEEYENLSINQFQYAIRCLIGRHDILRCIITEDMKQMILNYTPLYVPEIVDLSNIEADQLEDRYRTLRVKQENRQIGYNEWPFFDVTVVKLQNNRFRILWSLDLMIADALSLRILNKELWDFYHNPEIVKPELEFSYRQYVLNEQMLRKSTVYIKSESYWRARIENFPSAPELPITDFSNLRVNEITYENFTSKIERVLWDHIKYSAKKIGCTPTAILLSTFADALSLWSGQERFVITLTMFNRMFVHPDVEHLVGDFTGISLLEVNSPSHASFEDRVKGLQLQLWKDLEHQYFSGIEVIRSLSAKNGDGTVRMPIVFTSLIGFESDAADEAHKKTVFVKSKTSQVWLDHQVQEIAGELHCTWTVVKGLFPDNMVEEMMNYFLSLLKDLATDDQKLRSVGHINTDRVPSIQNRIHVNNTKKSYKGKHLLEGVLRKVKMTPNAKAIVIDRMRLTYRELWQRSGWFYGRIKPQANGLVAIIMDKGWEQIVGVIGILRSGHGYVPIDANWPVTRIRMILEEIGTKQVATQSWYHKKVTSCVDQETEVIVLDTKTKDIPYQDKFNEELWSHGEDIAYIIFTSGSTGKPKGVTIQHMAVVNTIEDINDRFRLTNNDKVLALSSLSFDLSVYDIFGLLWSGGTIVLPTSGQDRDALEWSTLIKRENVTIWNSVPALMEILLEYDNKITESIGCLKLVMLSGDWINVNLPPKIWKIKKDIRVISLGGATECSIWSVYYPIKFVDKSWKSIPYGKALGNQHIYVYNDSFEELPAWVTGEIYIGGLGLAKEYWNDLDRTNEKFVINPNTGERLYKTGDRGCYLPDHNIQFQGRMDFQVKLRGHRIELGEIENAIQSFDGVKEAIAAIVTKGSNSYLGACITLLSAEDNSKKQIPAEIDTMEQCIYLAEHISPGESAVTYIDTSKIDFELWSELMLAFRELPFDESPLGKFRYPSAGSLYPVHVYVSVGKDAIPGLSSGNYYYERSSHTLVQIAKTGFPNNSAMQIYLVGYMPAISPLYGVFALEFCFLEAGYMLGALERSLKKYRGLELAKVPHFSIVEFHQQFQLDDNYVPLACCSINSDLNSENRLIENSFSFGWPSPKLIEKLKKVEIIQGEAKKVNHKISVRITPKRNGRILNLSNRSIAEARAICLRRQSIRVFNGESLKLEALSKLLETIRERHSYNLKYYIFIKRNQIDNVTPGLYQYLPKDHLLDFCRELEDLDKIYNIENQKNFNAAAFSILFCHENDSLTSSLVEAGRIVQHIMEEAGKFEIGLCPIGEVYEWQKYPELSKVIHSVIGGKIYPWQLKGWHPEWQWSYNQLFSKMVKNHVADRLPAYMIPTVLKIVKDLPLSNNGKIDRSKVNNVLHVESPNKKEILLGGDDTEMKLLAMWRTTLEQIEIGIDDNFFEVGGNSMIALRLIAVISREFGVKINVGDVYRNSTVKDLAKVIRTVSWVLDSSEEIEEVDETLL